MPEAITIKEEVTPALSLEDQASLQESEQTETQDSELLAGKYKSVEDLEKGYQELQQKLSKGEPAEESEVSESEGETTEASATELYGDFIGGRFEENGIDFQDMNTRWQQSGELTTEDYGELEGAGFTREMVDAYLSGVQFKATQDSELAAKEVLTLKNEFGGEKAYSEMIEWAGANLSEGEVTAFNNMIKTSNMDQLRIALTGLQSKYNATANREPNLIGGKAPKGPRDKFESTAQVVAAMNDPLYQTDSAYRKKVEGKLARSNVM
mgnify:CR=1 FL=1|tara:strand:+ start:661 stop:1461 length:801 start_codon:yes stop_codon:yes gene_type:complete